MPNGAGREFRARRVIRKMTPDEAGRYQAERAVKEAAPGPRPPADVAATLQVVKSQLVEQGKIVRIGNEMWRSTREYVPFLRHIPLIGPVIAAAGITMGRATSRVLGEVAALRIGGGKGANKAFRLGLSMLTLIAAIAATIFALLSIGKIFRTVLSTFFMMFSMMVDLLILPFIPLFTVLIQAFAGLFPVISAIGSTFLRPIADTAIKMVSAIFGDTEQLARIGSAMARGGEVFGAFLADLIVAVTENLPGIIETVMFASTLVLGVLDGVTRVVGALGTSPQFISDLVVDIVGIIKKVSGFIGENLPNILDFVSGIVDWFLSSGEDLLSDIEKYLPKFTGLLDTIKEFVIEDIPKAILWIKMQWSVLSFIIDKIWGWLKGTLFNAIAHIRDAIDSILNLGPIRWLLEKMGLQAGVGYVPQTSLAVLHRGEAVLPVGAATVWRAGGAGSSVIISNVFNIQPGTLAENVSAGLTMQDIFTQGMRSTLARVI